MLLAGLIVSSPPKGFRQFLSGNGPRILLLEQSKKFLDLKHHFSPVSLQKSALFVNCLKLKYQFN